MKKKWRKRARDLAREWHWRRVCISRASLCACRSGTMVRASDNCDQQIVSSTLGRSTFTHTHAPLSRSSVIWYGLRAVMLCGWKVNCVPGGKQCSLPLGCCCMAVTCGLRRRHGWRYSRSFPPFQLGPQPPNIAKDLESAQAPPAGPGGALPPDGFWCILNRKERFLWSHTRTPFPSLPLEVGPLNPARESGERCKFPQRGLGRSPSRTRFLVHFSLKVWHLVATILMIFLRINWPNFAKSVNSKGKSGS